MRRNHRPVGLALLPTAGEAAFGVEHDTVVWVSGTVALAQVNFKRARRGTRCCRRYYLPVLDLLES